MRHEREKDTRIRVRDYTWNPREEATRGVVIMRGQYIQAFIPYQHVAAFSDRMIDLLETYENENQ
ncbi:hypothetical protein GMA10_08900 [Kocuria koreensis]|uniref:DUF3467 domain-containing protein n=1 Tax=Rothia koreensis TaxID=592378 RepID=A0A7K1LJV8_9MICC|nr:hypothetical protein [Rothia koreensis]MUN55323.1 hypothetical protein [Rothia koreensis]